MTLPELIKQEAEEEAPLQCQAHSMRMPFCYVPSSSVPECTRVWISRDDSLRPNTTHHNLQANINVL
jgi:hypothetical protein